MCDHTRTTFIPTPELIHHGKTVCADCGTFLGWVKKPETIERDKANTAAIARLKDRNLTEWEKGFILSLEKQGRGFSPKQQAKLDKLAETYWP